MVRGYLSKKEHGMLETARLAAAIFVDRNTQHWVVRDPDGNFWSVPSANNAWEQRQPYEMQESSVLEPIPSHYLYLLRLPF